jgi:hypothetical protein
MTDKFYIGSTCLTLTKRLSKHNADYRQWLKGSRKSAISSFKILEFGDAYIELLEECPCENKTQLQKREGELIRLHKESVVNSNNAGVDYSADPKAYHQSYREEHHTEIQAYNQSYREEHYTEIKERTDKWAEVNRERRNAYKLKWYHENKHKKSSSK